MSEPSSHISLLELAALAEQQSELDFIRELGGWVLVGPPVEDDSTDWNYRTLSARSIKDQTTGGEFFVLRDSYGAFPLKKRGTGPFADTVFIGRSSSNDCRIPHKSISKLHARVRMDPETRRPQLSDAGSSNGTRVNEDLVAEGTWVGVDNGDVVELGSCCFRVLSPDRIYQLVSRLQSI